MTKKVPVSIPKSRPLELKFHLSSPKPSNKKP
jgi:hypothetical protein